MRNTDGRAVRSRGKMMRCTTVEEAEREVRRLLTSMTMLEDELLEIHNEQKECERSARMYDAGLVRQRPLDAGPRGKGLAADPTFQGVYHMSEWYLQRSRQLSSRAMELMLLQEQLDELMKGLSDMQRRIIKVRWIEGKPWSLVSARVYLCDRQAQRIHRLAITRMAERYLKQAEKASQA